MKETTKILSIILLMSVICSCNTFKQSQRKDTKAVERVLAKKPLLDIVGLKWLGINPCVNDEGEPEPQPPIYIKGKDSSYPVLIKQWQNLDTTIQGHHIWIDSNGFHATFKVCNPDTIKQHFKIPVRDRQFEKLLNDSLAHYKQVNFALSQTNFAVSQKNQDLEDQAEKSKGQRNWAYAYLIIVFLLAVGSHLIRSKIAAFIK